MAVAVAVSPMVYSPLPETLPCRGSTLWAVSIYSTRSRNSKLSNTVVLHPLLFV